MTLVRTLRKLLWAKHKEVCAWKPKLHKYGNAGVASRHLWVFSSGQPKPGCELHRNVWLDLMIADHTQRHIAFSLSEFEWIWKVECKKLGRPPVSSSMNLVSMNSSSDDLIESGYYMLIPMQHISVLRIFSNFCINPSRITYAKYHGLRQRVVNFPSKSESHHWLCDLPEVWPLYQMKLSHQWPALPVCGSVRYWEDEDVS